jgi:hypothetical protein
MLREDALDYYYDNANDKGFSFEAMYHTQPHSEGNGNQKAMLEVEKMRASRQITAAL